METDHKPEFTTGSGAFEVRSIYTPEDNSSLDYDRDIGSAAQYPFTRGYEPNGYRENLWRMAAYAGFGSGEDANERFRRLVGQGATRLGIALDLPTQLGYNSDQPEAYGEVGKIGVAVNSLRDVEELFCDVPMESVRWGVVANSISPIALGWFLGLFKKKNIPFDKVSAYVQNDCLKEFIVRGTYIFPPEASLRVSVDVMEYFVKNLPRSWTPAVICGSHMRFAGASPAQEVGFMLANAITYLEEARSRGIALEDLVTRLEFHLAGGLDIFEEAAKYRALRKVWARIMKEKFGVRDPQAQTILISSASPGYLFTAQQILNNITRNTLAVLGAVLGGVHDFTTYCHDEALSIPTAEAATTALRIQQIIGYESGVSSVNDPLGGSYYVESLTAEMEKRITEIVEEVIEMGGAVKAISSGHYQRQIADNAYHYQRDVETKRRTVVGVNKFVQSEDRVNIPIFRADPRARERQIQKLNKVRIERDNHRVRDCLRSVEEAARGSTNVVPSIVEAVEAYATVGEISEVLAGVFGRYKETAIYM